MKFRFALPDTLRVTQTLAALCILFLISTAGFVAVREPAHAKQASKSQQAPEALPASGPESAAAKADKKIVHVGFYLNRLTEVSHKDGTLRIDAWFWFRWKDKDLKPFETFELVNGEIEERQPTEVMDDEGFQYSSVRVRAKVFKSFDVENYPFDNHTIPIELEDSNSEFKLMEFEPDASSKLDPSVSVDGWNISLRGVRSEPHTYPTNYGFQSLGENNATYSRFIVELGLDRHESLLTVVKLFWVSYLALILAIGACFVKSSDIDARFGIGLGSIFAASANTIAVSAELPDTPVITLAEQINIVTVLVIFMTIFLSIISLRLRHNGREYTAEVLDFSCAGLLSVGYIVALLVIF